MKKNYILLLLIALGFYSCEKDDFCIEPITPNLIVRFYDASNTLNTKTVTDLSVAPNELENIYSNASLDSIAIPLDVSSNQTIYNFTSGTAEDQIIIDYEVENVFVSRSCGFKAIFNNVTLTTTNNWIISLSQNTVTSTLTITSIEDEKAAHVQVFH